jgi:hypothetical protein
MLLINKTALLDYFKINSFDEIEFAANMKAPSLVEYELNTFVLDQVSLDVSNVEKVIHLGFCNIYKDYNNDIYLENISSDIAPSQTSKNVYTSY